MYFDLFIDSCPCSSEAAEGVPMLAPMPVYWCRGTDACPCSSEADEGVPMLAPMPVYWCRGTDACPYASLLV